MADKNGGIGERTVSGVSGLSQRCVRCLRLETQCVSGVSGIHRVSGLAGDREACRMEIGKHTVSGVSGIQEVSGLAGDRDACRMEIGASQCVRCVRYTQRFGNIFDRSFTVCQVCQVYAEFLFRLGSEAIFGGGRLFLNKDSFRHLTQAWVF